MLFFHKYGKILEGFNFWLLIKLMQIYYMTGGQILQVYIRLLENWVRLNIYMYAYI